MYLYFVCVWVSEKDWEWVGERSIKRIYREVEWNIQIVPVIIIIIIMVCNFQ